MPVRVVVAGVDAQHEGRVQPLAGSGHDDLARAGLEVPRRVVPAPEPAGGLDHHLGVDRSPVQLGRVMLGGGADARPIDDEGAAVDLHPPREPTVGGVVPQQMGERAHVHDVVHADHLHSALGRRPHHQPAYAAEPVDAYPYGHLAPCWAPRGPLPDSPPADLLGASGRQGPPTPVRGAGRWTAPDGRGGRDLRPGWTRSVPP